MWQIVNRPSRNQSSVVNFLLFGLSRSCRGRHKTLLYFVRHCCLALLTRVRSNKGRVVSAWFRLYTSVPKPWPLVLWAIQTLLRANLHYSCSVTSRPTSSPTSSMSVASHCSSTHAGELAVPRIILSRLFNRNHPLGTRTHPRDAIAGRAWRFRDAIKLFTLSVFFSWVSTIKQTTEISCPMLRMSFCLWAS